MMTSRRTQVLLGVPVLALVAALVPAVVKATDAAGAAEPYRPNVERGAYLVKTMMCNDCHTPWKMGPKGPEPDMTPTEIKLRTKSRVLEVAFDDGSRFELAFEYLRVFSPSAEVRGHGPGQETLQLGKHEVVIRSVEPVGNYAVKLVFSENRIEVTANSPDVGEAQESMDVIYQGPPMQIAFNPEFLQAPLRNLDSDDVYLDLIDEMSPGVLRIEGTFLYVLMPMRVTN